MIMIDAEDVCKRAESLRADIVAKIIGRLGVEKTMFEAADARTADWFISQYGPKVNDLTASVSHFFLISVASCSFHRVRHSA